MFRKAEIIERLVKSGASALSNFELLALALDVDVSESGLSDVVSRLGLFRLSLLSFNELRMIEGIGVNEAARIKAIFELNRRCKAVENKGLALRSAEMVYDYIAPKLVGKDREHFMVLHLDTRNRVVKEEVVSIGTLNSSLVHPREVFKSAVKENANSIIIVHNHPSGDPEPSEEDKRITEMLVDAGELLGIKVLDHVIVGKGGYYSFNEE